MNTDGDEHGSDRRMLGALFDSAKQIDEFEFCCALIRIRGLEDPGWDPMRESYQLTRQLLDMIESPIEAGFRLRLMLFLYCHVAEMDGLFSTIANMACIATGGRCSIDPLRGVTVPPEVKALYSVGAELQPLISVCNDKGFADVGQLWADCFDRQVRNAFFHSDYVLHGKSFNIRDGQGALIEGKAQKSVPLEWLLPRMRRGIEAVLHFMELRRQHIMSYSAPRRIMGRFGAGGEWIECELTGNAQHGLTGFRSPPSESTMPLAAELPPAADMIGNRRIGQ